MLRDADEYVKAFHRLGESAHPDLKAAFKLVSKVAPLRRPFLICGETGTGKEVVAHAIHESSHSPGDKREGDVRPFVAVNCASLPADLVDAELFGHVKGAFTGANAPRAGLFSQAHGGTIFLDEIGEMPLTLQAKLLRVLDSMEVRPVGATASQKVDVMVIAATNRDLEREVREGRFRQDLFHRLAVARVNLPPLRERSPEEILALAEYYVRRNTPYGETKTLSPEARAAIAQYAWPGNVRELENCVGLAVAMSEGREISCEVLGLDTENTHASKPGEIPEDLLRIIHNIINLQLTEIKATGKHGHSLKKDFCATVAAIALNACEMDTDRTARILDVDQEVMSRQKESYQKRTGGRKIDLPARCALLSSLLNGPLNF